MTKDELLKARKDLETIIYESNYIDKEKAVNDLWDFLCKIKPNDFEIEVGKEYVARFESLSLSIFTSFHIPKDARIIATGIGEEYIKVEYNQDILFIPIEQFKASFKPLQND